MPPIPLLLSAGETSGDMYAARLASALKQRLDVAIFGMGGPQMLAAGVEIITDYSEVSVVGITEVLKRLPSLTRAMRHRSEEHTSELQSRRDLVCRLLLEKKKNWSEPSIASSLH